MLNKPTKDIDQLFLDLNLPQGLIRMDLDVRENPTYFSNPEEARQRMGACPGMFGFIKTKESIDLAPSFYLILKVKEKGKEDSHFIYFESIYSFNGRGVLEAYTQQFFLLDGSRIYSIPETDTRLLITSSTELKSASFWEILTGTHLKYELSLKNPSQSNSNLQIEALQNLANEGLQRTAENINQLTQVVNKVDNLDRKQKEALENIQRELNELRQKLSQLRLTSKASGAQPSAPNREKLEKKEN